MDKIKSYDFNMTPKTASDAYSQGGALFQGLVEGYNALDACRFGICFYLVSMRVNWFWI